MSKAKVSTKKSVTPIIYGGIVFFLLCTTAYTLFEATYKNTVYPNVYIDGMPFAGQSSHEVEAYWESRNAPFSNAIIELTFENTVATISGAALNIGFDASLSAMQAFEVGRSGHFFTDTSIKFFRNRVNLTPYFRWNTEMLDETLSQLAQIIDIPPKDALFQFEGGKVTAFQISTHGRQINKLETIKRFESAVRAIPFTNNVHVTIDIPVVTIAPVITTENVNSLGIKELIGKGYSEFQGSIPGRIHNVILAASRLNGVLVPPGKEFSFNETVGDISAATGYQSAYIIKDGRTVLGDGGGVCQVSSTLFRAALNAGLPITERQAHAYRVHYYEEGGYKAGLDATVFGPTVDLKFKNDTPSYILIQTKADAKNLTLTFEFYGTSDGRNAEILNHVVYGITPAPPPLYQDDPTLPIGVEKQVDFAAAGAKASFDYKVTRKGEVLQDTTFYSNFRPWQAVFLKGTKPL